jgi:hypothetical protein
MAAPAALLLEPPRKSWPQRVNGVPRPPMHKLSMSGQPKKTQNNGRL